MRLSFLRRQNLKYSQRIMALIQRIEEFQGGQPANGLIRNVEGHQYINEAKTALCKVADRLAKEAQ